MRPGRSERSHTADEFVLEEEILAGARFYAELVRECARLLAVAPLRQRRRRGGGARR